jgi:hypothetical protein
MLLLIALCYFANVANAAAPTTMPSISNEALEALATEAEHGSLPRDRQDALVDEGLRLQADWDIPENSVSTAETQSTQRTS